MRILMLLEPAAYRGDRLFLAAHFRWVDMMRQVALSFGDAFALAANDELCTEWRRERDISETECFRIDAVRVLGDFGVDRDAYSKALYRGTPEAVFLVKRLQEIKHALMPDLILMTSQNAFVRQVFSDTAQLWLEQSPLPRSGQPFRTFFDPTGHQVGALLGTQRDAILSARMTDQQVHDLAHALARLNSPAHFHNAQARVAQEELIEVQRQHRVALLATQPPNWITYEGAGERISVPDLIQKWARRLPEGWVGVPTFHVGQPMDGLMAEIASLDEPKLVCLSLASSVSQTESLIPLASGLVTLTSNSAMTAVLHQKPVVVTGQSPFRAWAQTDPSKIEQCEVLSTEQVLALLAFLTHRHTLTDEEIHEEPERLHRLWRRATRRDRVMNDDFDLSGWTAERIQRCFQFA